ncbi:SMP-30/gluconolactonase/LRE family protein [Pseudoroseomonas cervicalis]|uniref:SMP-30/gluconolactonase/LRE family protein n=1 Tax=Teichococcus cervicalis TaxID=204525 RepID=UPI0022F19595|nr:SMP-30/gluconolactonase/LRE family protein [Pseudoroseomonas cervicalis]WBV42475.1 SMP-30/gluconolactonase/LRE family protein [Pseudoroseomonas cervicalis]
MWFPAPRPLTPKLLSRLPDTHRQPRRSAWADAHRGGALLHSFLEGPCFDDAGNLMVVDIPFGRVFRVGQRVWEAVAEYDGWPNGLALGTAGSLLLADHRHGLLSLDPASGSLAPLLENLHTEGFKGLNDVTTGPGGQVLFTDQGQTGLQDPTGRLHRLWPDGRVETLLRNGPSPNGVALNRAGTHAYVAMTRSCDVWRFALRDDGFVGKAQCFLRLPGGTMGPDGMAVDVRDRLFVANPGHGMVWGADAHGQPLFAIDCREFGRLPTNCCFAPDGSTLLITESESGSVLAVEIPQG